MPTLRLVMIAGLVGNVLVLTAQQIVMRTLIPPLAVILALTLVVAAICASRWRWAALVVVVWCVLSVIPGLEPYTYNLTHTTEIVVFIATWLGLGLLLVAVVAGVADWYADCRAIGGRTMATVNNATTAPRLRSGATTVVAILYC